MVDSQLEDAKQKQPYVCKASPVLSPCHSTTAVVVIEIS